MKKIILSLLAATALTATAQAEVNGIGRAKLFKNLGVSVEAGVHGAGANLTTTLVHHRLYLTLGYNFPAVNYDFDLDVSTGEVNGEINKINNLIQQAHNNNMYTEVPLFTALGSSEEVNVDANVKLFPNFKAMLQFFPSKNAGFHFTAGVMIGESEILSGTASLSETAAATYKQYCNAQAAAKQDPNSSYGKLFQQAGLSTDTRANVTIADKVYEVMPDGNMNVALEVQKIKPYIGIGFGNAVPQDHRVGFQFELGTWLHGTPKLTGDINESLVANEDDDELDGFDLYKIKFVPTMTFRITGRIF